MKIDLCKFRDVAALRAVRQQWFRAVVFPRVRLLVTALVLARSAQADPIADREREATALEARGDLPALQRAASLRAALGQRAMWIADVARAMRLAPRSPDTAALVFDLARASPPHVAIYVERFAEIGGPERAVIAHAMLGEQRWTASCPRALDGLCIRIVGAAATACTRRERWTRAPRDERANAAVVALDLAVMTFDRAPSTRADVRAAYANAKRILADRAFEQAIDAPLPKLSFTSEGASRRSTVRFRTWIDARMKRGGEVARQYEAILALKEPHAAIASAFRIGQLAHALSLELTSSPLPHRMAQGPFGAEQRDAYCETMHDVTEPLDARALDGFAVCAAKARELDIDDRWAEGCRRMLERVKPEEFPPLRERVARPGVTP